MNFFPMLLLLKFAINLLGRFKTCFLSTFGSPQLSLTYVMHEGLGLSLGLGAKIRLKIFLKNYDAKLVIDSRR